MGDDKHPGSSEDVGNDGAAVSGGRPPLTLGNHRKLARPRSRGVSGVPLANGQPGARAAGAIRKPWNGPAEEVSACSGRLPSKYVPGRAAGRLVQSGGQIRSPYLGGARNRWWCRSSRNCTFFRKKRAKPESPSHYPQGKTYHHKQPEPPRGTCHAGERQRRG